MGNQALISDLIHRREQAVKGLQSLVSRAEHRQNGVMRGEDEQTAERLNRDIDDLGHRIEELADIDKVNADIARQRSRFEHIVRPDSTRISSDDRDAESFFRGDGRRSIDVRIPHEVRKAARRPAGQETRDLVKGTTTAGGFIVPTGFVSELYRHLVESAGIRQTNAKILTTDSGETLQVPKTDAHGTATLVAEAGAILEGDPTFEQVTLTAYKYGQLLQLSHELVADTSVDLLGYVAEQAGAAVGNLSGQHMITGTGTAGGGGGQPEGVMTNITAGVTLGTGNTLGFTVANSHDALLNLVHSIVSGYRRNAQWLMNDLTVAVVRRLKDADGQYLWQTGMSAGEPDRLLGYPVVTDPTVAVFAANAKVAAFGDFSRYYTIRDVSSVRFERSDDFAFANDLVSFRTLLRTDGRVVDTGAVKSLVASAA